LHKATLRNLLKVIYAKMKDFNLKNWLISNKAGMYSKVLKEATNFSDVSGGTDQIQNRGDLDEINPAALGAPQAAADMAMQKQDDENGDWVDNASMDVVAEEVEGGLTFADLPECVKTNYGRNVTTSVAFVKKDGTVRHMAFRRSLAAYVPSDKPKSDAQLSMRSTHNLMNVYDVNAYIKALNSTNDPSLAAKSSFRNFKLENVLAFMCGGKVYDMRDRNQIEDRFGEEVHNQLTKKMVAALNTDLQDSEDLPEVPVDSDKSNANETVGWVTITKSADPGYDD